MDTAVTERGDGADVRPAGNFFVRHWRGELSLGVAYWVVNLLVFGAALLVSEAMVAFVSTDTSPGVALVVTFLGWAALILIVVWQIVGLWRSASAHERRQQSQNKTRFWAVMAKVMAVVGALQALGNVATTAIPQISELHEIAIEGDPSISDGEFKILAGGTELSFAGGIKYGVAAELERILKTAPDIRVLHLTSEGGRLQEAIKLFRLVVEHGLETYVSNECASACTLVFAAGKRRWLSDAARLGFHPAVFPGFGDKELREANEEWMAGFEDTGIDAGFVNKVLALPPQEMWYPTVDELLRAKIVTDIDAGENFQTSGNEAMPTLAEIEAIARENHRLIDALHELAPDLAREIYVKLRKELVAGTLSRDTLDRLDLAVEKAIMAYLPLADDEVLVDFAALTASRLSWMLTHGAATCFEHTQSGGLPDLVLTQELKTRTVEIYEKILRTVKERPVPDPAILDAAVANAIEAIPDDRWLVYLDTSRDIRPNEYEAFCRGGIAFFQAIAGLPREQAAAVMRDMYRPLKP
ncbi:hypothetical protein [Mesorhizobium sp. 1B3]|uniref:hypothetical protein n=1 Tax=Mesorhizobium sp. 1B3 TaxID=3243599 RepID=UPI003D953779